jgi:hypothetical protein
MPLKADGHLSSFAPDAAQCPECGVYFVNYNDYRIHLHDHHWASIQEPFLPNLSLEARHSWSEPQEAVSQPFKTIRAGVSEPRASEANLFQAAKMEPAPSNSSLENDLERGLTLVQDGLAKLDTGNPPWSNMPLIQNAEGKLKLLNNMFIIRFLY